MILSRLGPRTLAAIAVAVLVVVAGTLLLVRGGDDTRTVSAYFPRAVSIYEGSDVRILGVNVGRVTAVTPAGNSVRVEMEYDAEYDLPADAKAVIVTPTLVADRFVQLTPVYDGGPKLADGAEIALPETGVPIELDRIYAGLQELTRALGPNGVNKDGTLDHLLTLAARSLDGRGELGNEMLRNLSEAAETFGEGSGPLFSAVSDLARFTQVLARNDELVSVFIEDLAGVSANLADERQELQAALAEVASAVGIVESFVRDNREALTSNVERLTRVAQAFAAETESLNRALIAGPVGITNLNIAFDTPTGSIGSRIGIQGNIGDVDGFLCGVVQQLELNAVAKNAACRLFKLLIEPIGDQVAGGMERPAAQTRMRLSPAETQATYSSDTSSTTSDLIGGR
jgi:virulence factor Mce-like protein